MATSTRMFVGREAPTRGVTTTARGPHGKEPPAPPSEVPDTSDFSFALVERIAEQVLVENLRDVRYDPARCKQVSQELASTIMDRLKDVSGRRYKLVAVVSVGSLEERPGVQFGSRCLWNAATDSFSSVKFTNGSLFAVALVYGFRFA